MDSDKFREKIVKAESAFNVVPENIYLDPEYELRILRISTATRTGLLAVVRVEPTSSGLPAFVIRWDDSQNTVDVDLEGGASDRDAFKKECNGYKGHHPTVVSTDPRIFRIDIQLPQRKVYEALLTCNIGRGVRINASLELKDEFSAELLPKLPKARD